jgi:tRNA threonylcarbamoyladenosine biosynthesis protein TsaE
MDSHTFEFFSHSPEQTRRLGSRLGALLRRGDMVCLSGDLGSGKTTLVQGIAQGWGSLDAVSSPTFVLVNSYRRIEGPTLFHLDAYRLKDYLEAEDLDLDLMIETGALIVEWPERIALALPTQCLWVDMRWLADELRGMVFSVRGKSGEHTRHYEMILEEFQQKVFGG